MSVTTTTQPVIHCYHCGEPCLHEKIAAADHTFCCQGCRLVYEILNKHELCDYYELNKNPGAQQRIKVREDKFAFLDDAGISAKLINYQDEKQVHATFYVPQMHCSSCLYLLEHLYKLDHGVVSSKVNFTTKEVAIVFDPAGTTIRKIAELLTSIGYEPYISLHEMADKKAPVNKSMTYRLGVAGFCFGNVMLMSFPEYLGIDQGEENLLQLFRWLNVILSIPVFFYSSYPFYESAWKSIRHRFLNIDAPIALAIIITFVRSLWEVFSGTGSGYFDSMTGIVFFMLAGRVLQDKTYRELSFERDYTSYFPIAATVIKDGKESTAGLPDIKPGDTLLIHNEELIPADGILTRGSAYIDYSFVTGESAPVLKEMGEMVYAGGKQKGANIEILVIKEVAQSYLTRLWNRDAFRTDTVKNEENSFVHLFSRYFTYIVLVVAFVAGIYWWINDASKLWPAVTAVFIVACPCALLLSNTFTNGNIIRILGRNRLYLRNAQTIESIAGVTHIIFDKTGTLTTLEQQEISYTGEPLSELQKKQVAALAACSNHPLSKALSRQLGLNADIVVKGYREEPGKGIEGFADDQLIALGTGSFVTGWKQPQEGTTVYLRIESKVYGFFRFQNHYRDTINPLIRQLRKKYRLSVLSGDNDAEKNKLRTYFGDDATILFNQKPEDKLEYIHRLQQSGEKVMMIGDGLNDAGALRQSDAGIALTENTNNFTPSSDAILSADQLPKLNRFIRLCVYNKKIVSASFAVSIIYNIIGLYFAVSGQLSPMIAAILMPSSSLSILLLTFGGSNLLAWRWRLKKKEATVQATDKGNHPS